MDHPANFAAAFNDQRQISVDLTCARIAVRCWAGRPAHPRPRKEPPTPEENPGRDDLDRWGQTTLPPFRSGYSALVRATLHRIGLPSAHQPAPRGVRRAETTTRTGCVASVSAGWEGWGYDTPMKGFQRRSPSVPEGARWIPNGRWPPRSRRLPNGRPPNRSRFGGDISRACGFPSGTRRAGLPRPAATAGRRYRS